MRLHGVNGRAILTTTNRYMDAYELWWSIIGTFIRKGPTPLRYHIFEARLRSGLFLVREMSNVSGHFGRGAFLGHPLTPPNSDWFRNRLGG